MTSSLTQSRLRELLNYSPESGQFAWKVSRHAVPAGSPAGSRHKHKGYVNIRVDRKAHGAHRLAWLYVHGAWPEHEIDHRNGDRTDNRIANLRDVPHAMNMQNMQAARGTKRAGASGWSARIRVDGGCRHIGTFDTEEAAHLAYLAAKRQLHAGYAA